MTSTISMIEKNSVSPSISSLKKVLNGIPISLVEFFSEENIEEEVEETPVETFDVNYSCLRCGTSVSNTELSRLPEIKCICGFRVFTKDRPPVVKTVKAI